MRNYYDNSYNTFIRTLECGLIVLTDVRGKVLFIGTNQGSLDYKADLITPTIDVRPNSAWFKLKGDIDDES